MYISSDKYCSFAKFGEGGFLTEKLLSNMLLFRKHKMHSLIKGWRRKTAERGGTLGRKWWCWWLVGPGERERKAKEKVKRGRGMVREEDFFGELQQFFNHYYATNWIRSIIFVLSTGCLMWLRTWVELT